MSPKELTTDEKKRLQEIQSYLTNHLEKKLVINAIAKRAAMSEDKLKEGFFKLFGMTVGNYLHETKMQTGYFLLQNTEKPIKEIAGLTGYKYTKNFLIAFKKRFGVTAGSIPRINQ